MTFHNKTGEKLKLIEFSKINYTKGFLINKELEKVVDQTITSHIRPKKK
jgi:hypothetical protein